MAYVSNNAGNILASGFGNASRMRADTGRIMGNTYANIGQSLGYAVQDVRAKREKQQMQADAADTLMRDYGMQEDEAKKVARNFDDPSDILTFAQMDRQRNAMMQEQQAQEARRKREENTQRFMAMGDALNDPERGGEIRQAIPDPVAQILASEEVQALVQVNHVVPVTAEQLETAVHKAATKKQEQWTPQVRTDAQGNRFAMTSPNSAQYLAPEQTQPKTGEEVNWDQMVTVREMVKDEEGKPVLVGDDAFNKRPIYNNVKINLRQAVETRPEYQDAYAEVYRKTFNTPVTPWEERQLAPKWTEADKLAEALRRKDISEREYSERMSGIFGNEAEWTKWAMMREQRAKR